MSNQNAAKRTVLEKLLEQSMVLVTLDARAPNVMIPSHLQGDPQLRLNLSFRFGLPIDIGEDGISATLTFGGVPSECFLPWGSVYMFVSHATGQPFMFPADIPPDVAPMGEDTHPAPKKPALSVVAPIGQESPRPTPKSPVTEADENGDGDGPKTPDTPRRGHLRLVK